MDDLAALRLQIEWGADEALDDVPHHRFTAAVARRAGSPAEVRQTVPRLPAAAVLPDVDAGVVAGQVADAGDFEALQEAIDGFHACPLRATASTTVVPSGNPRAGLVMVAEAPGPEDDRAGRAFSGPPGERLDRIIGSAGLSRADLLLTFLVPWRPPGGRPPNEAELAQCVPFLHRLLTLAGPRYLVLLGAAPLRALSSADSTLRRVRGKWTPVQPPGFEAPIPALPMLAPELWLSSPANKQSTWNELLLLKEALALD